MPALEPSRIAMYSIVLDSVHKIFRPSGFFFPRTRKTESYALKGITFNILRGEVLALLGPNGSGKSTTLKLISTVLLPDRGDVLVNGCNTRDQARRVRAQVGFALASERSFFPRLTVRENLDFFAALENVPRNERALRVQNAVQDVQLESHAGKQAMKLSSGLQQRLGIARALVKSPRIVLLDEPTRSLDPASAEHLWRLVRQLAQGGITIVLATHNFAEAASVSDRVAILHSGHLRATVAVGQMSVEALRARYMESTGSAEPANWLEQVPA